MQGFVLVLVVDSDQAKTESEAIARVARDYDVSSVEELEREILTVARQAGNQLRGVAAAGGFLELEPPSERVQEIARELARLFDLGRGRVKMELFLENGEYAALWTNRRWTRGELDELDPVAA